MVYQEELRAKESLALWIGDLASEDALLTYLREGFEKDFGILLNDDESPEFACSFESQERPPDLKNLNRRRASAVPFDKDVEVGKLMEAFSQPGPWISHAVELCHEKGIRAATVAIVFPNLSYRAELCRNHDAPIRFVGNVTWPEGRLMWEESEKLRLVCPPFPKLLKKRFGQNESKDFEWEGVVRLKSWTGFATPEELHLDGFVPTQGICPEGDLEIRVVPVTPAALQPTEEQKRTFQYFLDHEREVQDRLLAAIFEEYPKWRENYYGAKFSYDNGKTWQTGWEHPESHPRDLMPEILGREDLRRLIRPQSIYVMANPRERLTRVGFSFSCRWDDEHGLGVSTHAAKVLAIGGADDAFSEFYP